LAFGRVLKIVRLYLLLIKDTKDDDINKSPPMLVQLEQKHNIDKMLIVVCLAKITPNPILPADVLLVL
jgi:hypothetical protein